MRLVLLIATFECALAIAGLKPVFVRNHAWRSNPASTVTFKCDETNATGLMDAHDFTKAGVGVNKTGFLLHHSGSREAFIETGTNDGRNIETLHNTGHFKLVSSIEFSPYYFARVNQSLGEKVGLRLYQGDSGAILPSVLKDTAAVVSGGALIWLDAHYSLGKTAGSKQAEPPILREMTAILSSEHAQAHMVMIDDVRLWSGSIRYHQLYPTPTRLQQHVCNLQPKAKFRYENDALMVWVHR